MQELTTVLQELRGASQSPPALTKPSWEAAESAEKDSGTRQQLDWLRAEISQLQHCVAARKARNTVRQLEDRHAALLDLKEQHGRQQRQQWSSSPWQQRLAPSRQPHDARSVTVRFEDADANSDGVVTKQEWDVAVARQAAAGLAQVARQAAGVDAEVARQAAEGLAEVARQAAQKRDEWQQYRDKEWHRKEDQWLNNNFPAQRSPSPPQHTASKQDMQLEDEFLHALELFRSPSRSLSPQPFRSPSPARGRSPPPRHPSPPTHHTQPASVETPPDPALVGRRMIVARHTGDTHTAESQSRSFLTHQPLFCSLSLSLAQIRSSALQLHTHTLTITCT